MDKNLNDSFKEAVKIASKLKEKLPQDTMLRLYAYYKQATKTDNFYMNARGGIKNAFKFNAWVQLKGMKEKDAKKAYIKLIKKITKQNEN